MGCGEENLFSKRFLPHKTVLQHPHFLRFFGGIAYKCKVECRYNVERQQRSNCQTAYHAQQRHGCVGVAHLHAEGTHTLRHGLQQVARNGGNMLLRQAVEYDGVVHAVEKFRLEIFFHFI